MSGSSAVNCSVDEFDSGEDLSYTDARRSPVLKTHRPLFELPNKRRRTLGNFQDRYLELGQWPEWSPAKHRKVQEKLALVKTRYSHNKRELRGLSARLAETQQCQRCDLLSASTRSLKQALEEAVQLSYLLLAQVYSG